MVPVPGQEFLMGSARHYAEERPERRVAVHGFWIDRHPVTNAQFLQFVEATGHVTGAERAPSGDGFPDAPAQSLVPGSLLFRAPDHPVDLSDWHAWWRWEAGANWRQPEGPGSSIAGRERHPVVHVAYADAQAYAAWCGKALPREQEWEAAARGGLAGLDYAWGEALAPAGQMLANYWQGNFPLENLALDGYCGTSPVGSFPPNRYGLFDMIGNVWEWTESAFTQPRAQGCCATQAAAPSPPVRTDRVLKGGSYLCAPNYCQRYRPAARSPQSEDTSACHIGFRCVVRQTA